MKIGRGTKITIFVVLLLIVDQVIKIWIKTHMPIGGSIDVFGDWFQLYFVENVGMAFGVSFGGNIGKLCLTLVRIALGVTIVVYIRRLLKNPETPMGVLLGLSAIVCGAFGNIIDSLLYGVIFSESSYTEVAMLFPPGGGYAPPFFGKVVDMFYFPIIDTTFPEWFPFIGGEPFRFFEAVFNFADSCIVVGSIYLLIFHWRFFNQEVS